MNFTIADFVAACGHPHHQQRPNWLPDMAELRQAVDALSAMLHARESMRWTRNDAHATPWPHFDPTESTRRVQLHGQRLENLFGRMQAAMNRRIDTQRNRVTVATARGWQRSVHWLRWNGATLWYVGEGRLITTVNAVTPGESLAIQVADGIWR